MARKNGKSRCWSTARANAPSTSSWRTVGPTGGRRWTSPRGKGAKRRASGQAAGRLPGARSSGAERLVRPADDLLIDEGSAPIFISPPARLESTIPTGSSIPAGNYSLFFQHNPYGRVGQHALGPRRQPRPDSLAGNGAKPINPTSSARCSPAAHVVDPKNTSGLARTARAPPMVFIYTAAGKSHRPMPRLSSTDGGKRFTKYAGNPVVPQITPGNRDPKVLWHEPTAQWVMAFISSSRASTRSAVLHPRRISRSGRPRARPRAVLRMP